MTYVITRRSAKGEARWVVDTSDQVTDVITKDLVESGSGFPTDDIEGIEAAATALPQLVHVDSPPFPKTETLYGNTYTIEEGVDPFAYPVELSRDDNGTVLVRFPDVRGAITFGENDADALDHAVDALETMLVAHMLDRKDIPAPSPARGRRTVRPTLLGTLKVTLYQAMRARGWRKADLARALGVNPRQVDRLLDLRHASTVKQLEQALAACGKRADVSTRELQPA